MNQSMLYKPPAKSQIWVALAAATLLHVAAVVVAEHQPTSRSTASRSDARFF